MALSHREFRKLMRLPGLRARLRGVAEQVADRTRANLAAAGVDAEVTVEEGIRPRGRSYARVTHTDKFGEFGTEDVPRHRALGRAIGSK
ncbi:hypothetical protein [Amycolatopsis anabasis]|uniref:hypothetical protein n=1 Tax=Amycolatopsis anabasis TaxID=1840409 RepID=UPI00131DC9FD|nr:hypothetical protein [Amycolatopsis anabasis]